MSKKAIGVVARRFQKSWEKKKGQKLKITDLEDVLADIAGLVDFARYMAVVEKVAPTGALEIDRPQTLYMVFGEANCRRIDDMATRDLSEEDAVLEAVESLEEIKFDSEREAAAYRQGINDTLGWADVQEFDASTMKCKVLEGWREKYGFMFGKTAVLKASTGFCEFKLTPENVWSLLIAQATESEADTLDGVSWHLTTEPAGSISTYVLATHKGIEIACETADSLVSVVQDFDMNSLVLSEDGETVVLKGTSQTELPSTRSETVATTGKSCNHCHANLSSPGSVIREYIDKDGEFDDDSSSVFADGHYDEEGYFDPDESVSLSGGRYDLADNSDKCAACGGQL